MVPKNILYYFKPAQIQETLNAGFEFAEREMNWSVSVRAELYQIATVAFGPEPDFESFSQLYNKMVAYWQISRTSVKGVKVAPAEQVFEMLVKGCAATNRHTGITLLNSDDQAIRFAIRAMSKVKANSEYPHMAAAKFLHFYNPLLFPMYDDEVIWKRVLHGVFRQEWTKCCKEYGINVRETTEKFLIAYFAFAAECMAAADKDVMVEFDKRFRELGGSHATTLGDTTTYYAAAFEYLLMGAAKLKETS